MLPGAAPAVGSQGLAYLDRLEKTEIGRKLLKFADGALETEEATPYEDPNHVQQLSRSLAKQQDMLLKQMKLATLNMKMLQGEALTPEEAAELGQLSPNKANPMTPNPMSQMMQQPPQTSPAEPQMARPTQQMSTTQHAQAPMPQPMQSAPAIPQPAMSPSFLSGSSESAAFDQEALKALASSHAAPQAPGAQYPTPSLPETSQPSVPNASGPSEAVSEAFNALSHLNSGNPPEESSSSQKPYEWTSVETEEEVPAIPKKGPMPAFRSSFVKSSGFFNQQVTQSTPDFTQVYEGDGTTKKKRILEERARLQRNNIDSMIADAQAVADKIGSSKVRDGKGAKSEIVMEKEQENGQDDELLRREKELEKREKELQRRIKEAEERSNRLAAEDEGEVPKKKRGSSPSKEKERRKSSSEEPSRRRRRKESSSPPRKRKRDDSSDNERGRRSKSRKRRS
eukprot:gnl/MRDRNA2_/MRDRNA2_109940_c0_seq1.p1 gnl/MRDRNA2_/MRDRNA2_109940_c0~~gnl/MRDRNA2_/MRDRNA2_109940_c0_seq1.p1  ORF type:complete len:454 (+),score=120.58 gnl/MRDRNA2_/MRDRNA2_109940_c0_seq1:102-1463(+)